MLACPELRLQGEGQKAPGLSRGVNVPPLAKHGTHVLSCQAGETAKLAGETRSPHKPHTGCSSAPGPAGDRQGATGVRFGVARPVDGPLETALGAWASTGEASIPEANAIEGERISTSRLQVGESQMSIPCSP